MSINSRLLFLIAAVSGLYQRIRTHILLELKKIIHKLCSHLQFPVELFSKIAWWFFRSQRLITRAVLFRSTSVWSNNKRTISMLLTQHAKARGFSWKCKKLETISDFIVNTDWKQTESALSWGVRCDIGKDLKINIHDRLVLSLDAAKAISQLIRGLLHKLLQAAIVSNGWLADASW